MIFWTMICFLRLISFNVIYILDIAPPWSRYFVSAAKTLNIRFVWSGSIYSHKKFIEICAILWPTNFELHRMHICIYVSDAILQSLSRSFNYCNRNLRCPITICLVQSAVCCYFYFYLYMLIMKHTTFFHEINSNYTERLSHRRTHC